MFPEVSMTLCDSVLAGVPSTNASFAELSLGRMALRMAVLAGELISRHDPSDHSSMSAAKKSGIKTKDIVFRSLMRMCRLGPAFPSQGPATVWQTTVAACGSVFFPD